MTKIAILYTTVANRTAARKLSKTLLDARVVACAVAMNAESAYTWNGTRAAAKEIVLVCKTSVRALSRAKKLLDASHPYDVPCILSWTVDANMKYANWIFAQTL